MQTLASLHQNNNNNNNNNELQHNCFSSGVQLSTGFWYSQKVAMSKTDDPSCQASEKGKIQDCSDAGKTVAVPECAVCLQNCIHPARLPCNHVFCYLCVKGVANQSKRCPMCRQEIPADFLEHPQLLELLDQPPPPLPPLRQPVQVALAEGAAEDSSQEECQWFYEGRNGWWQYDRRTNVELETAYKQGKQTCELLIAGFLYIADFATMFQVRRNDHSRRRRIKRDLRTAPKKGIAGLRLDGSTTACDLGGGEQSRVSHRPVDDNQEQNVNVDLPMFNAEDTSSDGIDSAAAASTANVVAQHPEQSRQPNALHQVLQQMRSVVLRGNFSSVDEQNSNDIGSVLDYSSLSQLHRTTSNTINTSDEEQS